MCAVRRLVNQVRRRKGFFHITPVERNFMGDVSATVNRWARSNQCFVGVQLSRQKFVFDFNQIQGVAGNVFCGGGHGHHLFTCKTHHILCQYETLFVMNAPRGVGRLSSCHNGFDPWQRQCRSNVDIDDASVGMGASKHFAMQHAGQMYIPGILGAS